MNYESEVIKTWQYWWRKCPKRLAISF